MHVCERKYLRVYVALSEAVQHAARIGFHCIYGNSVINKFQVGEQMGIKWYLVEHSCVHLCVQVQVCRFYPKDFWIVDEPVRMRVKHTHTQRDSRQLSLKHVQQSGFAKLKLSLELQAGGHVAHVAPSSGDDGGWCCWL